MIDEMELRALLQQVADVTVVPPEAAGRILAIRDDQDRRRRQSGSRPWRGRIVPVLVAVGACSAAVLAAVLIFGGEHDTRRLSETAASAPRASSAGGAAASGATGGATRSPNELEPLKQFGAAQSAGPAAPA